MGSAHGGLKLENYEKRKPARKSANCEVPARRTSPKWVIRLSLTRLRSHAGLGLRDRRVIEGVGSFTNFCWVGPRAKKNPGGPKFFSKFPPDLVTKIGPILFSVLPVPPSLCCVVLPLKLGNSSNRIVLQLLDPCSTPSSATLAVFRFAASLLT